MNIKGGMTIYYTEKDFVTDGDQYITGFAPVKRHSGGHSVGRSRC